MRSNYTTGEKVTAGDINEITTMLLAATATPTASTLVKYDQYKNVVGNAAFGSFGTTAGSNGTTTMTAASAQIQALSGSSSHTHKLPTTDVLAGFEYVFINGSTGNWTIQSSGANTIVVLPPGASVTVIALVNTPTTAANWSTDITSRTLFNPTITNFTESVVANGTVTTSKVLDLTNGTVHTATLTASTACTFTMPTASAGKSFTLLLKQAASTGNGTATFTGVKWPTAGAPTITATAGKMDILNFVSDGVSWYGSYTQGYTP